MSPRFLGYEPSPVITDGDYRAIVFSAEGRISSNDNPMVKIEFTLEERVMDNVDFRYSIVRDYLVFSNGYAGQLAIQKCEGLGISQDWESTHDTPLEVMEQLAQEIRKEFREVILTIVNEEKMRYGRIVEGFGGKPEMEPRVKKVKLVSLD